MIQQFNTEPRPRALLIGLRDSECEALSAVLPTVRSVDTLAEASVHDFDVLITTHPIAFQVFGDLNVIFIDRFFGAGAPLLGEIGLEDSPYPGRLRSVMQTRSTEYRSGSAVPPPVDSQLSELATQMKEHVTSGGHLSIARLDFASGTPQSCLEMTAIDVGNPFLVAADETFVAGAFTMVGGKRLWFLPGVASPVPWALAAWEVWSDNDPEHFPQLRLRSDTWWRDARYSTAAEGDIQRAIASADEAEAQRRIESEQRRNELQLTLSATSLAVDAGERRLLTHQGDELHAAVIDALCTLGFEVRNMDDEHSEARLEDLRVSSPTHSQWVAIAEVRGYSKGAKGNDLWGKMTRYRDHYILKEQRLPDAAWYIVNHNIERAVDDRPVVLAGADGDIDAYATNMNGLVLDTSDLYQLLRSVERGEVTAESVRGALVSSRGRFSTGVLFSSADETQGDR